jgi:hypothetical protein
MRLARPELLELRPSWGEQAIRASSIALEPLESEQPPTSFSP